MEVIWNYVEKQSMVFIGFSGHKHSKLLYKLIEFHKLIRLIGNNFVFRQIHVSNIVKLGSLVSHTEWSNISERNSNLIENLKKGPEMTL